MVGGLGATLWLALGGFSPPESVHPLNGASINYTEERLARVKSLVEEKRFVFAERGEGAKNAHFWAETLSLRQAGIAVYCVDIVGL